MKNLQISAITFVLFALLFSSCLKEDIVPIEKDNLKAHFTKYETLEIDYNQLLKMLESNGDGVTNLNLNIPSKPDWEFTMTKEDVSEMFPADSKVILIGENESLTEMPLPKFNAFEGRLLNSTNPTFFSFTVGEFEAEITDNEGEVYSIQSMKSIDEHAAPNLYIIYNQKDIINKGASCTAYDEGDSFDHPSNGEFSRANCYAIEVTQLSDYEFYRYKFGSSYAQTSGYMSSRLYWASRRYWAYNRYPINFVQRSIYVYTSNNDGLVSNNSSTMLSEWRAFYNRSWYDRKDVNSLWSGKAIVSGIYGLAGVRTLCTNARRAFNWNKQFASNAQSSRLLAHEIGHNIGAPHDNASTNFMNGNPGRWNNTLGQNARNNIYGHIWNGGGNRCLNVQACR